MGRFRIGTSLVALCASAITGACLAQAAQTAPAPALITEPGPGDLPFLQAVQSARASVDLVMYELSDGTFERALVSAEKRGIKVRVLLDDGEHGGGSPANDSAYRYLTTHGVAVRWAPAQFALTHQKTLVIDGRTAYIMTLNLVASDYPTSRDFAVTDTNPRDVSAIEATFTADWNDDETTTPPSGADLVWSPGALDPELSLIESARRTLDIYNEEMDDSVITSALEAAARRGVDVEVVMTASHEWDDAFASLTSAGVHVRTYPPDASLYIHAKMILADGRRAFLGSQNFSAASLDDNRELGIILSAAPLLRSLETTFAGDYARATPFRVAGSNTMSSAAGRHHRRPTSDS